MDVVEDVLLGFSLPVLTAAGFSLEDVQGVKTGASHATWNDNRRGVVSKFLWLALGLTTFFQSLSWQLPRIEVSSGTVGQCLQGCCLNLQRGSQDDSFCRQPLRGCCRHMKEGREHVTVL